MNPEEYRRLYEAEDTHWWFVGMRRIAFEILDAARPALAQGRILDAGCGTGSTLAHLTPRGRPIGVDLAPEALAFCQKRGVVAARAALESLPFQDAAFSCVTSFDVLYHQWVEDDLRALRELVRVLEPGGLLVLRLPALEMLRGAHDEAVQTRRRYTKARVRSLLDAAGVEILRITYCNSLLFPLMALRRARDRFTGSDESDVAPLPPLLDRCLGAVLSLEAFVLRFIDLPVGSSLMALARKPAGYNAPMATGKP